MSTLEKVEQLLGAVEKSMKSWVRNDYERRNLTSSNLTRLGQARLDLTSFDGDYITALRQRITNLEKKIVNQEAEYQKVSENLNAFKIDFTDEGDVEGELVAAEQLLREQEKAKADKRKGRRGRRGKEKGVEQEDPPIDPIPVNPTEMEPTETPKALEMKQRELIRFSHQSSSDVPVEAMGNATVFALAGTPIVALEFDSPAEYDFQSCFCRVEMYRCIFMAGLKGEPLEATVPLDVAAYEDVDTTEESDEEWEVADATTSSGVLDDIAMLSGQLVQDYAAEVDEEALSQNVFPMKIKADACQWLRSITSSTWTILLCHGGYFAGGVFAANKCIVHKAFQRYVVRKKQGGKQSNAQKDGGSFGSIGSQIRAAQELKWRVDVRDLLLEWKSLIDSSSVILYAAPGPSNRSILTNFSLIPVGAGGTAKAGRPSPIDIKDPRVWKVPLSTHRPSFAEIQRIFDEVSSLQVVYVQ